MDFCLSWLVNPTFKFTLNSVQLNKTRSTRPVNVAAKTPRCLGTGMSRPPKHSCTWCITETTAIRAPMNMYRRVCVFLMYRKKPSTTSSCNSTQCKNWNSHSEIGSRCCWLTAVRCQKVKVGSFRNNKKKLLSLSYYLNKIVQTWVSPTEMFYL